MARPIKQGLDYYPLDVGFLQDVKVRRTMRACGIQSIPVLISLLGNIYRNDGYYIEWDNDMPFLVADELGINEGAVTATVDKAVQVGFFDAKIYQKYNVLTSSGIQTRFFDAVSRRSAVRYDARFMLINVTAYKNLVNVYNNSKNVYDNQQSKVKKRKVKKSKVLQQEDVVVDGLKRVTDCYSNNIHPVTGEIELQQLKDWTQSVSADVVIKAIDVAVKANKRSLSYIKGILNNWQTNGINVSNNKKAQKRHYSIPC